MGQNFKRSKRGYHRVWIGTLTIVLAGVLAGCTPAVDGDEPSPVPHQSFVSRAGLAPPQVMMSPGPQTTPAPGVSPEYVFLTPGFESETPSSGAMIFDLQGELVWMAPSDIADPEGNYFDLRVQEYRGDSVLTVYKGTRTGGRGNGEILILDASYEQVGSVTTSGSLEPGKADFHDSTITAADTMLIAPMYPPRPT